MTPHKHAYKTQTVQLEFKNSHEAEAFVWDMIWSLLASVLKMLNLKSVQPFVLYSSQRTSEAFLKRPALEQKNSSIRKG